MYIIFVFAFCNKMQTEDPEYFRMSCWSEPIKVFVNSVGNRWAISPNSEIFPPDNIVHQKRLQDLQNIITSMNGVFTTEIFEKSQKAQEEIARIRKDYLEILMSKGDNIAKAVYERRKAEILNKDLEEIVIYIQRKMGIIIENIGLNQKIKNMTDKVKAKSCFWLKTQVKLESGCIIKCQNFK